MKPNIIHITFDCVRPDHFGISGYRKNTTPFLDTLARNGRWYRRAYATGPGSSVSFVGMFTSTYPLDHGGYSRIDRPRVMFPELLQAEGYTTLGIHSSPYFSEYFGYNRGWDVFRYLTYFRHRGGETSPGLRRGTVKAQILKKTAAGHRWLRAHVPPLAVIARVLDRLLLTIRKVIKDILHFTPAIYVGEEVTAETEKLLEGIPQKPVYLWVHYLDAHAPYGLFYRRKRGLIKKVQFHLVDILLFFFSPFPSVSKLFAPLYVAMSDDSLRHIDESVQKLFATLTKRGILNDDAVVIMHADHGEDFYEHGTFGHEQRLYNVNIRVPLMLYAPKRFSPETIETPVSLVDIAPTILDLAGIAPPDVYKGKSLLPGAGRNVVIQASECAGNLTDNKFTGIAIVSGGYKFIQWKGERHLFELSDEAEKDDLFAARRDIAEKLEREAMKYAPTEPLR